VAEFLEPHRLAAHPEGFVINTTRTPSAAYLMLHRATCWTINRLQPQATTFTGDYSKLCEAGVNLSRKLTAWAGQHNPAGTASNPVSIRQLASGFTGPPPGRRQKRASLWPGDHE
jgi:hypothetical protein